MSEFVTKTRQLIEALEQLEVVTGCRQEKVLVTAETLEELKVENPERRGNTMLWEHDDTPYSPRFFLFGTEVIPDA